MDGALLYEPAEEEAPPKAGIDGQFLILLSLRQYCCSDWLNRLATIRHESKIAIE